MRREKAQEERRLRGICGESTVCVLVHYQALELGSLISKLKVTDQDTIFSFTLSVSWVSLVAQMVKNPLVNAGDSGPIPGLGGSPGEGNGNSLQYCCLENPMDRGAWWATVQGVAKGRTLLSD